MSVSLSGRRIEDWVLVAGHGFSDPDKGYSSSADFDDGLFGGLVPDERVAAVVVVFGVDCDIGR